MRDISKRLTVINTEKKDNASDSKGQSSGVTYVGFGGGGMKNLNDYLLKSIWDRVWEIRTDSQGTEYIFGKLPVVTQYGITMYSGENTDIPTIAEGLPFDNRTIWFNPSTKQIEVIGGIGGGSGEGVSNFWDLSGIPSWITNTKPTYSYSEIQGTPDLSVYALVSQIPSLEGYALSSDLAKYIPISGYTDITGEKNFTGGLKVNGSPIYYDTEKKYWKLEGDLLVTGGVTMYGNEGTFTPSTIMDAIAVDGTTISKEGGILKVIGDLSGGATTLGSLTNVGSWADSVASQDRIMYQAANSSQWVAKNLSDLAVGGVTGDYLPLTGGTLTGTLELKTNSSYVHFKDANGKDRGSLGVLEDNNAWVWKPSKGWKTLLDADNYSSYALPLSGGTITNTLTIDNSDVGLILHRSGQKTPYIRFGQDTNNEWGELGVYNDGRLVFWPLVSSQGGYNQWNTVWHAGNDGSGSGLDADLLDGKHYSDIINGNVASATRLQAYQHNSGENKLISGTRTDNTFPRYIYDNGWGLCLRWQEGNGVVHNGTIATLNDNVASATKLQTPRTIWGQSFDGTGDITGKLTFSELNGNIPAIQFKNGEVIDAYGNIQMCSTTNTWSIGLNYSPLFCVTGSGNVGIGTVSPEDKLHIVGNVNVAKPTTAYNVSLSFTNTSSDLWQISGRFNKNVSAENNRLNFYYYNGTTWSNIMTLYNNGNMFVSGGITMYSARKLKNITDERGLSLKELSVIKPTRFTWKDGRDDKVHIGGIADDVMKVLPEVIYKTGEDDTLTMDYGNAAFAIAASLIKPVITHEEEIKVLKNRIKELEEQVKTLSWNIA